MDYMHESSMAARYKVQYVLVAISQNVIFNINFHFIFIRPLILNSDWTFHGTQCPLETS